MINLFEKTIVIAAFAATSALFSANAAAKQPPALAFDLAAASFGSARHGETAACTPALLQVEHVDQAIRAAVHDAAIPPLAAGGDVLLLGEFHALKTADERRPDRAIRAARFNCRLAALRAQAEGYLRGIILMQREIADEPRLARHKDLADHRGYRLIEHAALDDTRAVSIRRDLADSRTVRQALRFELTHARGLIEAMQEHQADLLSALLKTRHACRAHSTTNGIASGSHESLGTTFAIPEEPAAMDAPCQCEPAKDKAVPVLMLEPSKPSRDQPASSDRR